jgi:hypothetical protein
VQSQTSKRILLVAISSAILGTVIWVSARSRSISSTNAAATASAPASKTEKVITMPSNVVTMLGVPEVILSAEPSTDKGEPPPQPTQEPAPNPTKADRIVSKVSSSAATQRRSNGVASGRHPSDTFLVKPQ